MKKYIFLITIISCIGMACTNSNSQTVELNRVLGKWKILDILTDAPDMQYMVKTQRQKPEKFGTYEFKQDSTCVLSVDGNVEKSSYEIKDTRLIIHNDMDMANTDTLTINNKEKNKIELVDDKNKLTYVLEKE